MGRSIYLIVLLGLLSGCVPMQLDSSRDQFGVSTGRPDAGAAPVAGPQAAALDAKANAICTLGYQTSGPAAPVAVEDNQQLITQTQRCAHYDHLRVDTTHIVWSNLF
jgi:hypothetical protein